MITLCLIQISPVGWAVLLSAMMIQLSVASCQPGLRQSLLQLSAPAPSAHRATEWAGWGAKRNDTAIIQPWSENRQHFVKGCESWKEQRKVYSNEQYTEVWCCKLKIQSYSVCYVDEPVVKRPTLITLMTYMQFLVIIQHYTSIEPPSEQTGQLSLTEMLKGLSSEFLPLFNKTERFTSD